MRWHLIGSFNSKSKKELNLQKFLEPISKIRLGFRARRETVKKRSIHVVCEHFERFRNAAMGTQIVFEIGFRVRKTPHLF